MRPAASHSLLSCLVLALCAPLSGTARAKPKADPPVAAVLEAAGEDGKAHPIDPGDVLCSGESFVVRVIVSKPRYAYLVFGRHQPGGDRAALIFPPPGQDPVKLAPGGWRTLPLDDSLELDGTVGAEHLFVITSERPLPQADAEKLARDTLRSAPDPQQPAKERACAKAKAEPVNLALAQDYGKEVYRDVLLHQKPSVLRNANIVRIPIVHR